MMQYAGVWLSEPDGTDIGAWIAETVRPEEVFLLAFRSWPGALNNGPVLNITPELPKSVTINYLFWPWSASRFAFANFVVTGDQLALIRKQTTINGRQQAALFVFSDGDSKIETNLWMLPALPLSKASLKASLYLITLVDDRYWWQAKTISYAVGGATPWTTLYSQIGASIGVTIVVDPVQAAYDTSPTDYSTTGFSAPAMLDAVAFSVGQRIVRRLNGDVRAQNYSTSKAILAANQIASPTPYAGGVFDLMAGSANDLAGLVPSGLNVVFPNTPPTSGQHIAAVNLFQLSLPGYAGIVGSPWQKSLHRYEKATATNLTTLSTLAAQIGTDWYNWQLASLDKYFVGILDWNQEGFHDAEWRQSGEKITTHVKRGPFNPIEDLLYYSVQTNANNPPPICDPITFTKEVMHCEDCNNNVYTITTTFTPNPVTGCLEKAESAPVYTRSEGKCCGGEVVNIYYTTINDFTTYIQNLIYFNVFDQKFYYNFNNIWYIFCPCDEISGSGKKWYCVTCPDACESIDGCATATPVALPSTQSGVLAHGESVWFVFDTIVDQEVYYVFFANEFGIIPSLYTGLDCDHLTRFADGLTSGCNGFSYGEFPGKVWVKLCNLYTVPQSWSFTAGIGGCAAGTEGDAITGGVGDAPQPTCMLLSDAEKAAYEAKACAVTGPYNTQALCRVHCGSSGSGGGIVTPCCPDTLVPTVLHGVISARTGGCVCMPDTLTFTNFPGTVAWYSDDFATCNDRSSLLKLQCNGPGDWTCDNASVATGVLASSSCDPFQLVFHMTGIVDTCTGTYTITLIP